MIKEIEIDELSISLNWLRIFYLLACLQTKLSVKRKTAMNWTRDSTELSLIMVLQSMQWCQSLSNSLLGHWSVGQPGCWYSEHEWLWWTVLLTLQLQYHMGLGRRNEGLWWRSCGLGHSRSNQVWLLGAGYFGYTINQIMNMIKDSEIDELSVSLNRLRISYLLACHQAKLSIKRETAIQLT